MFVGIDKWFTKSNRRHYWLFVVAFVLMPLDSSPFFPIGSVYRPLSLFPIIAFFLVDKVAYRRFSRGDIALLCFFFGAIALTGLASFVLFQSFNGVAEAAITSTLAIVLFSSTIEFFRFVTRELPRRVARELVVSMVVATCILPLVLSAVQVLTIVGVLPFGPVESMMRAVSYRVYLNRAQGISGEPSWSGRHLVILLFVYLAMTPDRRRSVVLMLGLLLGILFSGSAVAYLTLVFIPSLALALRFLVDRKARARIAMNALVIVAVTIASYQLLVSTNIASSYATFRLRSVAAIVLSPSFATLAVQAAGSSSLFQRVFNPIVGFMLPFVGYPFGVGLENYNAAYAGVVQEYFSFGVDTLEVQNVIAGTQVVSSKMLPARIVAEFGFVGIAFIGYWIAKILRQLRASSNSRAGFLLYAIAIGSVVNFDSYIFVNFAMVISLAYWWCKTEAIVPAAPAPSRLESPSSIKFSSGGVAV